MKMLSNLFLIIVVSVTSLAQGTFTFRVHLNGAQAIPPTASIWELEGGFTLNGNRFGGAFIVDYDSEWRITSLQVFEASDSASYGSPRLDLVRTVLELPDPSLGFPGSQTFEIIEATLTPGDIASLMAGNWYVNLSTFDHPTGELRGRITLVPEPAGLTLLFLGAVPLLLAKRRSKP